METERLDRDLTTDVLVVGAGITGALTAQALAADGIKVVIADRRGPAEGATLASTALLQYEIDTPLTILTRKIGADKAARAWRRSRLAVDSIADLVAELGIADVARRDTLYLAGNVLDAKGLERESVARRTIGIDSYTLGRAALSDKFGVRANAALQSHGSLTIDPRKTTRALLANAIENKARIFDRCDIVDVRAKPRSVVATAHGGHRITCRYLVMATGYEMPKYVPQEAHQIISTWAIATHPQPGRLWSGQPMIWQAADPYLYVRTTAEGRVICGGEDEEFSDDEKRDKLIARKSKTLARKLKQLLPALDTRIEFAWAGSFGQTKTGLPIIGEIPQMPNCWAALGYGGNGTSYARIAAEIIRNAVHGHNDADGDLYTFPKA
ncbi:NAD(P)/FAD-dependent oxidoreductase [Variibacter gotjawalensis]|uniref:NAD(P)/FAD-dependent oxidoreductase n=1 Tax=Variibacter gotjawalensis TaxID=1333996 RepID=UPI001D5836AB|nr:FAD-dependent oxidoreductase [Variibacter gotjawalensis]NIK47513.1 glycine/D-amino acid oxidase-like deaminating enzyme [Variibacter gotjawalensis]